MPTKRWNQDLWLNAATKRVAPVAMRMVGLWLLQGASSTSGAGMNGGEPVLHATPAGRGETTHGNAAGLSAGGAE
jgi:hypothetical protein